MHIAWGDSLWAPSGLQEQSCTIHVLRNLMGLTPLPYTTSTNLGSVRPKRKVKSELRAIPVKVLCLQGLFSWPFNKLSSIQSDSMLHRAQQLVSCLEVSWKLVHWSHITYFLTSVLQSGGEDDAGLRCCPGALLILGSIHSWITLAKWLSASVPRFPHMRLTTWGCCQDKFINIHEVLDK